MATCSLENYLDGLASQLKDCTQTVNGVRKHVRWTREHLVWILCIAANQLKADRGDLFLEDHRLKLNIGCYTDVCAQGCDDIRAPIVLEGQECERITVQNSDNQTTWGNDFFPTICSADSSGEYKIDSIEIDPEDPCKIRINPEVPNDGVQRYIIARCSKDLTDQISAGGELPKAICDNLHAFTQLVLYYAYSMDGMVNVNSNEAQRYHENYRQIIGDSFIRELSLRDKRVLFAQVSRNLGE